MSVTVPKCRRLVLGTDFTDGLPSLSQSKEAVWQPRMGSAIHSVLGNRTVRRSEEMCPLLGLEYVCPLSRSIWSSFIDANPASGCPGNTPLGHLKCLQAQSGTPIQHLHLDIKHRYMSPYLSSSKTFHLKEILLAAQSTWLTSSFYQGLRTGSKERRCNASHTEIIKGRILFINVNFMAHSFFFFLFPSLFLHLVIFET